MNVRRTDGRVVPRRSADALERTRADPARRIDGGTSDARPTTRTRPRPSLATRDGARNRRNFESNAANREHVLQRGWGGNRTEPATARVPEMRLDPSNPAVLAGQLAYLDWQDPKKVAEDLKARPNLTQYSAPEIEALAIVALEHPEARPAIREAVTQTVVDAESLDDLPQTPGFQFLLSTHLLQLESDERTGNMYGAMGNLSRMVEAEVSRSFDRNLDGAEGDGEVDRAGERFGADLNALAEQYPALIDQIDDAANDVARENQGRIQDARRADDNFFQRANHTVTGGIRGGASALTDYVLPDGPSGGPIVGPSWLRNPTLQAISETGAGFTEQARGSIEGTAALITDPVGGARALVAIAKDPSLLLAGYNQIYAEHGANGLSGAIGFDMISAVMSLQPTSAAFGPVARGGATVARGAAHVLGDLIPEEKFLRELRKSDAFGALDVDGQATLLRWVDGKEPFISPQMRQTIEEALHKTDGWDDLPPAEREAMLLRMSMSMPQWVVPTRSVQGPTRFEPNAAGVLSDATPSERLLWTGTDDAVERTLRIDGRDIRILTPANEATQYSVDEVVRAIRSMPREARNQLAQVSIESDTMHGARAAAAPDGIPSIALFTTSGEKLTHDQLVTALVHESGHVMSFDRWGGLTRGPDWERWEQAMSADRIRASSYAAFDTGEDFAETFAIYHSVKGTEWEAAVRAKLSHRFAILDDFIAREGDRTPYIPGQATIYRS